MPDDAPRREPVRPPDSFFERLSSGPVSASDVIEACDFWRSLPLWWRRESELPEKTGEDLRHLLWQHEGAQEVIQDAVEEAAAEVDGFDFYPIRVSGDMCREALKKYGRDKVDYVRGETWPEVLSKQFCYLMQRARPDLWNTIVRAKDMLGRLKARMRMKMRESVRRRPGAGPMERRAGNSPEGTPASTPRKTTPKPPALSADDMAILGALSPERATLLLAALAAKVKRDVKTVGERVARLKRLGLVARPLGPRKGVEITKKGRDRLSPKPTH